MNKASLTVVYDLTRAAMLADKGKWGEEMSDLVGNAARSGAITCVVRLCALLWHMIFRGLECDVRSPMHPADLHLTYAAWECTRTCCSAHAHAHGLLMLMPDLWVAWVHMQIVASPVIGKVVIVGTDRTIGTVAGGVTGWLSFLAAYYMTQSHYLWQYAVLCLMVFIFGWASVVLGW